MNEEEPSNFCRNCDAESLEKFTINHYSFLPKSQDWDSFYCYSCGAVSDFKKNKNNQDIYSDGSYRNIKLDGVKTPIDFFSKISFLRWRHINNILEKYFKNNNDKSLKYLDYGGYSGFLQFALKQKFNFECVVADYDTQGLNIAKAIGLDTIDLKEGKISDEKKYDLISFVHVLEHMKKPLKEIKNLLQNLNNNGIIYAEVPNLYSFPMNDEAHLINFSKYSLYFLFKKTGLKIIDVGYCSSPKESIEHDYYYNSKKENLYIVAKKTDQQNNAFIVSKDPFVSKNISEFKEKLFLSYSGIMIKNIPHNLLKPSLKKIKTAILFFIYGLVDLISIKIFKFSLISRMFNRK